MKLMVTGGAGFIGTNFIHYWLSNHPEDDVFNFDVLTYAGNLENHKQHESNPKYHFVRGDICDRDAVRACMEQVDVVVHFAAESHVDRSIMDASAFVQTNVHGTQVLLDVAVELGKKRFHHISTDEVFGALPPDALPFTEETAYNPKNPYSATKAAADHLVRAYFNTHQLPVTISNCSNNYGPYHFPEKIIPLFISNLTEGKKVPVYGDGQQIRDWIHVDDHSRGVEMILQKGRIGETYCLGGDNQTANLDLTKKLIALLGRDESFIEFVKDRPGHDRRYDVDFAKAKEELGWEPQITLDEGLQRTIEWYQNNQEWVERCTSGAYKDYYDNWYNKTLS